MSQPIFSYIQGMGSLSCFGDETETLVDAVENNKPAPMSEKSMSFANHNFTSLTHKVPDFKLLMDLPRAVERRLGNLSRLCFQAILKAMQEAQFNIAEPSRVGLIIGSAHGATSVIAKYTRNISLNGGHNASPLLFSNSVHNSISSFISLSLAIKGPSTTIINGELSMASAIERGNAWIAEDIVDHVLIAVGDEIYDKKLCSHFFRYSQHKNDFNPLINMQPIMGEGVIGLVLGKTKTAQGQQSVRASSHSSPSHFTPAKNIVVDAKSKSHCLDSIKRRTSCSRIASYATQYGAITSGGALDLAIASFALRENKFLKTTAQHPEFNTVDETFETDSIELIQVGNHGELGVINIEKN